MNYQLTLPSVTAVFASCSGDDEPQSPVRLHRRGGGRPHRLGRGLGHRPRPGGGGGLGPGSGSGRKPGHLSLATFKDL